MKKVLIAMSHALTQAQITDLQSSGYEPVISNMFSFLGCNNLAADLSGAKLNRISLQLITEAESLDCDAIAMTGEPMLTFHTWTNAKNYGLEVLQSTTERKTVEELLEDGSVKKTQIFAHVQWRRL